MMFEHDFMTTPDGIRDYALVLQQIRLMVQRTNSTDVIFALMNTNERRDRWEAKYGIPSSQNSILARVGIEIEAFGSFQKNASKAPEMLHATMMKHALREGWKPDIYIFPPMLLSWIRLVPAERTYYSYAGPEGVRSWMMAPPSQGTLGGLPVYEADLYDEKEYEDRPPLMGREMVIGHMYVLDDRHLGGNQDKRTSRDRTIMIYNEDTDNEEIIGLEHILDNCNRFDDDGFLDQEHYDLARNSKAKDMFFYRNASEQMNRVSEMWGQMEQKNLPQRTIDAVMKSAASKLPMEERAAISNMVGLFESLMKAPVKQNAGRLVLSYTDDLSPDKGGLASWFGIELIAKHEDTRDTNRGLVAREGISAFQKYYDILSDIFGGNTNPVLDPDRCPFNMKDFVDNKGLCNLFERVVSPGSVPLFVSRTTPNRADRTLPLTRRIVSSDNFASDDDFLAYLMALEDSDVANYLTNKNDGKSKIKAILGGKGTEAYDEIYDQIVQSLVGAGFSRQAMAFVQGFIHIEDAQSMRDVLEGASTTLFGNKTRLMQSRHVEKEDFGANDAERTARVEALVYQVLRNTTGFIVSRAAGDFTSIGYDPSDLTATDPDAVDRFVITPLVCHKGSVLKETQFAFADPRNGYRTPLTDAPRELNFDDHKEFTLRLPKYTGAYKPYPNRASPSDDYFTAADADDIGEALPVDRYVFSLRSRLGERLTHVPKAPTPVRGRPSSSAMSRAKWT